MDKREGLVFCIAHIWDNIGSEMGQWSFLVRKMGSKVDTILFLWLTYPKMCGIMGLNSDEKWSKCGSKVDTIYHE